MKNLLVIFFSLVFAFLIHFDTYAQCAMCRATVEASLSTGEGSIGLGLNTGILYLMVMPYIVLSIIGYMWYRNSKKNHERNLRISSILKSKMP